MKVSCIIGRAIIIHVVVTAIMIVKLKPLKLKTLRHAVVNRFDCSLIIRIVNYLV